MLKDILQSFNILVEKKFTGELFIAERLSARQLIVQRSHIASVYIYIYIYIYICIYIYMYIYISVTL